MTTTFGSVCSGIEAASVAWGPLGWRAVWLAEIELYPRKVLAHYYPDVPNLGNMLAIPAMLRNGDIPAPDVFTGGTPCQAFSVAGLRASMKDARGNLSMTFCEIADEIDIQRAAAGLLPCIIKWENVPGVLTTKDNAFGCFLGGLAGEDEALVPEPCPPSGKSGRFWKWDKKAGQHTLSWPKCGVVLGPQRAVSWRVLDAQYFGLAQRRLRVFVVASAREGFDPAAVLLEFDGVRRDIAPSREAGQDIAAGTLRSTDGGSDVDHARAGHLQAVTGTMTAGYGEQAGQDFECMENGLQVVAPALRQWLNAGGMGRQDFETETMIVQSVALRGRDGGATAELGGDLAGTLRASGGGGDKAHVLAPIAFSSKDYGNDATVDLAPTMRAMNHSGSHANGGGQLAIAHAIQAGALRTNPNSFPDGVGVQADVAYTLEARSEVQCAQFGMAVRRLTPRECERLQGFPDDHTLITVRGKPVADGPRYKALGNSWAIPVVFWIGKRIDAQLVRLNARGVK